MSCNKACWDDDWPYGEIDCSECPYQDANLSAEEFNRLRRELDDKESGE